MKEFWGRPLASDFTYRDRNFLFEVSIIMMYDHYACITDCC